jgi:hypothetical protein
LATALNRRAVEFGRRNSLNLPARTSSLSGSLEEAIQQDGKGFQERFPQKEIRRQGAGGRLGDEADRKAARKGLLRGSITEGCFVSGSSFRLRADGIGGLRVVLRWSSMLGSDCRGSAGRAWDCEVSDWKDW